MIYVKSANATYVGGATTGLSLNTYGLTIEARIKYLGGSIASMCLFNYSGHQIGIDNTGTPTFMLGGPNITVAAAAALGDSNEHLISGTWDGNQTLSIYIDGVLSNTLVSGSLPAAFNPSSPYIANYYQIGDGGLNADFRDCRAWNVCRTAPQILSYLNYIFSGTETNLLGYYPCNEGSGTIIHDLTIGGHYFNLGSYVWNNSNPYTPPAVSYSDSSNAVFPALQGLAWPVERTAIFDTAIAVSKNLIEARESYTQYPIYKIKLSFEFLADDGTAAGDYQALQGFVLARHGAFEDFLFNNPDDNHVANQIVGVGDGVTTTFQLIRTYAGFVDAVRGLNGTPTVYLGGAQTTQFTITDHGVITFNTAPTLNTVITATFSFYYRVRFTADANDFSQFMSKLWELKAIEMVTVK